MRYFIPLIVEFVLLNTDCKRQLHQNIANGYLFCWWVKLKNSKSFDSLHRITFKIKLVTYCVTKRSFKVFIVWDKDI